MFWRKIVGNKVKLIAVASIEDARANDAGCGKKACLFKLADGTSVEHILELSEWSALFSDFNKGGTVVGGDPL